MGLRIIYSDSIEALTQALAAESTCGEGDALLAAPSRIMVPNANVEKWLKMQLAEANGVAMNLVFPYLERGLWELTAQAAGPDAGHPQATSAEQSRFAVAAGLIARLEQQEQDNPLVDFCLGQEATFSRLNPNQVRRVWQLSTDLSRLFREYEYHRGLSTLPTRATLPPGMANDRDLVGFWSHPDNDLGDPPDCLLPERITGGRRQRMRQIFGAQGALYQEAVSALAQGTPAAISLPTLARELDWNRAGDTLPRQPVRIFGVSQLSPFHCWLLHQLGRHLDIHLYHFNLCREFWEDIETPRELRHRICATTITADELDLSIENPLLNAWGKGGRETIRLLGGIEDSGSAQFTGLPCPTPRAESVLGLVQEGIGTRRANLQAPAADDATLELLACPSLRREVETVYNHIISSMSADPTLRQNDIAVLVPKMDSYRAIFESTFKARESLHFNLVDSHAGNDSVLGKGIQAALALVGSPFTRRAVFSVLANPCVLAAARASRDDLEHWGAWAEALGIFHHYDADHKAQAGIPPSSHHTWQQGLRRLRLGRVMDELPTSPQLADYPGHADMFTAGRALDRFSVLVERLYRRLQLLQQPRTPEQWLDELMRLVDDFFLIPRELPQEELVLRALRTALRDFAGQGNQMGFGAHLTRAGCREQRLPLEWIRQLMDESLASIPSGHGSYLSDGITIAALLPMRPIAFRRVYILGLEEGAFPGQDTTSTLDLRSCRRRVGDTSRSDVGRYIFLETLMATGERLCLSYVGRDLKKDEERQPCSVVLQLKAFIDQHVGADAGWSWQPRSVPLNSYSLSFAPDQTATPAEGPPQWDLAAQLLAAAVHSDDTDDTWQQKLATQPLSRRQRAAAEAAQRARQPRTPAEALADDADEAAVVVTIDQLATFIKDPAEAILRYRYRLRADEEADPAVAEDEPLTTGFPDNYRLQGEALRAAFIAGEPEAGCDHLEAAYATRIRGSAAVEDPFVPFDLNDLQKSITDCCGRTSPFTLLGTLALRAEEPDDATRALELTTAGGYHVSLCCKPRELTILSRSEEWQAGYLTVQAGAKPKGKGLPAKLLPAFLALCHEIAALDDQPDTARQRHLYAAYKARKGLTAYSLNITPQQARLYLENLVDDFLGTSACELLPYGLLQKRFFHTAVDPAAVTRSALQEAFEQDQTGGFASYRLPGIVALNRDRLSVPPHPAQLVERRLTWPLASAELTVKKGGAT